MQYNSIHQHCRRALLAQYVQEMPEKVTIFAVEVEEIDKIYLGLSNKVQASVDEVINMILDEVKPKQGS